MITEVISVNHKMNFMNADLLQSKKGLSYLLLFLYVPLFWVPWRLFGRISWLSYWKLSLQSGNINVTRLFVKGLDEAMSGEAEAPFFS